MNFNKKYFLSGLLLLLLLSIIKANAQEFVPPIQNFQASDYKGATQNWDISIGDNGFVYSANNQGLLVFDGLNWELHPLKGNTVIRSVYAKGEKIYTGSYKEFGYWKENSKGILEYHSLAGLMEDLDLNSEEFWGILSIGEDIYFRSFGAVYKYDGDKILKLKSLVTTSFGVYKNRLLVAERQNGVFFLNDDGTEEKLNVDISAIGDKNVIDILVEKDALLLCTKGKIYQSSDKVLREYPDARLHNLLSQFELNHIISLNGNEMVIGTVKNGIIHYNRKLQRITIYNRNSGLQNNTVLGLAFFQKKLWLALDRGIDVIELDSPIKFYTDDTGELGKVYDVVEFNDQIYLGSNTGIYTFKNGSLTPVADSEGHTWNLEVINGKLFANHNSGLFQIDNAVLTGIETRTGSYDISAIPNHPERLMISHYTGLSIYNSISGSIRELDSVLFPVKQVVFQNPTRLWAAHAYEGLYRIDLSENLELEKIVKWKPLVVGQPNYRPLLYEINSQIIALINGNWFKYDPFKDQFKKFNAFNLFQNNRLITANKDYYFFIDEAENNLKLVNESSKVTIVTDAKMGERLVKSNENISIINDSIILLSLTDGFAKIDFNKIETFNNKGNKFIPTFRKIASDSLLLPIENNLKISFQNSRRLDFTVGMPMSEGGDLVYNLQGEENSSGLVKNGKIELRNLPYGDYKIKVFPALQPNLTSAMNFTISPPWFLSNWMKFFYLLIFLLGLGLIFYLNKLKLKKHRLQLEEKYEKEHQIRLEKLEKERLIHEIDIKRKELANTTMMAAKKNEVLMEIQNELNQDKVKFSNQFRLKNIMTKINRAVKNKDEWQVFETNFNEVHEDFFKAILNDYPGLSSKDLKLCSYLKMNLSSKEIAPLMGISVRGVEVHRYRLRKKMKLGGDVNLTKFLIKNF